MFVVLKSFGGKYNIGFGIPIEFPSQRKKNYSNRSRNNEIMLNYLKMPKSSCLKWTYGRSGMHYRVGSLFTR